MSQVIDGRCRAHQAASARGAGGSVIMVGAFPPPMHGMAAVNLAVQEALAREGLEPFVINVAPFDLSRSLLRRVRRLPRVAFALLRLLTRKRLVGETLYLSVSGGGGQLYDIAFVVLARLRGMRIILHHHSYAYIDLPSRITRLLTRLAGSSTVHITQSSRMALKLQGIYRTGAVVPISNAFILEDDIRGEFVPRRELRTLGFISNISRDKGVFEFLDVLAEARREGLALAGKLAGPFQDRATEGAVRERLGSLPEVQYVGPVYGAEKAKFYSSIDVLLFPTRYRNETEGIVNHEAMSRGVPVIAYGRGCIPEIINASSGKVIDPQVPFVPEALAQIRHWISNPLDFSCASVAAAKCFDETFERSRRVWEEIVATVRVGRGRLE